MIQCRGYALGFVERNGQANPSEETGGRVIQYETCPWSQELGLLGEADQNAKNQAADGI
jgi:hypothetical protein